MYNNIYMNHLLNIVFLWLGLYFTLPNIRQCGPQGCYDKIALMVVALILQVIFHITTKSLINNNNKKPLFPYLKEAINEGMLKGTLVLLGYLVFMDLLAGDSRFLQTLATSTSLINENTIEATMMVLPVVFLTGLGCFLTPY